MGENGRGNGNGSSPSVQGRARAEGRRLFAEWFRRLSQAQETGEPVAYIFVIGNALELLRSFDFLLSFPEINALQTAVKKVSMDYLQPAEEWGLSPDVCGYVKADVGLYLKGGDHPMGRIPKPTVVVGANVCNTYIKWAEIWERIYKCPVLFLDIPGVRSYGRLPVRGTPEFDADKQFVLAQLMEMIEVLEKVTGKRFDPDRLAEVEGNINRTIRAWARILELNREVPAPYDCMLEGLTYLGIMNAWRGTPEGAEYMEAVVEELEERRALGLGTLPEERFRLVFNGAPCYPYMRRSMELFQEWGGVFVYSSYVGLTCGGCTEEFLFDTARPLESLAEVTLLNSQFSIGNIFFMEEELKRWVEDYKADGIVFHGLKSCRTYSAGMADSREYMVEKFGIPSLALESDLIDPRYWSEAQMKNRIDAYFEALAQRKVYAAGATGTRGPAPTR